MQASTVLGAAVIPILFLVIGAVGKKLVRGSPWCRSDWYLGPELALSLIPAALLYAVDQLRKLDDGTLAANQIHTLHVHLAWSVVFAGIALAVYMGLLSLHQDWEDESGHKFQLPLLGFVSNAMSLGLFFTFTLYIQQ